MLGTAFSAAVPAASISPGLRRQLDDLATRPGANAATDKVLTIVTFHTASGLQGVAELDRPGSGLLASLGITPSARLEPLGIIAAHLTAAQIEALAKDARVRSLYDNYRLRLHLSQARVLCGVDRLRNDPEFTALNGGQPVTGAAASPTAGQPNRPQFSVVVIDSGLDTTGAGPTGADLPYDNSSAGVLNTNTPPDGYLVPPTIPATKVIQNLQVTGSGLGTIAYTENLAINDSVGHGSHCAGIVGGLGTFSRTTPALTGYNASTTDPMIGQTQDFSGVATGARIIGCGSGAALFVLDALGGFNYAINFQAFYNVRVTSNSYGSEGDYDEADPLNVAIKAAYDRSIVNVFAAGNSGPGVDTISNSSKSPYVICVAAGTKEGGLVGFSSRGKPAAERTQRPQDAFNLPAITAPGTGREFDYNAPPPTDNPTPATWPGKRFTSDMISTRSKIPGAAAGTNDQEFPAPYQAVYTQISGTSMACPFVAGTVALLLDVDPTLVPDAAHPAANGRKGIKEILQATATHMPDYQDFEVGAGYLNAYAAVDLAFHQARGYVPFNRVDAPYAANYSAFNANISVSAVAPPSARPVQSGGSPYPPATVDNSLGRENFSLPFSSTSTPATDYASALAKASTGNNAYAFLVDANTNGQPVALPPSLRTSVLDVRLQFGNDSLAGEVGGNTLGFLLYAPDGTTYSSGISLPVLDAPTRQVVVKAPRPGLWVLEVRGLRGLAAAPASSPIGIGLPDTTTGQIYRKNSLLTNPPADLASDPSAAAIEIALLNRYMDSRADGTFGGGLAVSRADFAQVLADNLPVRQTLGAAPRFTDVSGPLARIAEAVTANGSTLRDWDFAPAGLMAASGSAFLPNNNVTRLQMAIAFVRGLGLDREAATLNPAQVTIVIGGQTFPVNDAGTLSAAERGYLQLALDRGFLTSQLSRAADAPDGIQVSPRRALSRRDLASALVKFREAFRRGN